MRSKELRSVVPYNNVEEQAEYQVAAKLRCQLTGYDRWAVLPGSPLLGIISIIKVWNPWQLAAKKEIGLFFIRNFEIPAISIQHESCWNEILAPLWQMGSWWWGSNCVASASSRYLHLITMPSSPSACSRTWTSDAVASLNNGKRSAWSCKRRVNHTTYTAAAGI